MKDSAVYAPVHSHTVPVKAAPRGRVTPLGCSFARNSTVCCVCVCKPEEPRRIAPLGEPHCRRSRTLCGDGIRSTMLRPVRLRGRPSPDFGAHVRPRAKGWLAAVQTSPDRPGLLTFGSVAANVATTRLRHATRLQGARAAWAIPPHPTQAYQSTLRTGLSACCHQGRGAHSPGSWRFGRAPGV